MSPMRPLALGTLVALVTLPALAQPVPGAPPAPRPAAGGPVAAFAMVDANGDGRVRFEEVWRFAQARFGEADRNGDGALVVEEALALQLMRPPEGAPRAEVNPVRARMVAALFRAVDANSDGRLTLEEIRPALEAQFRALDVNGDRGVTLDELPVARPGMHRGGPPPGGAGMAPPAR